MTQDFNCEAFLDSLKKSYGKDKEYKLDGMFLTITKRTGDEVHIWEYEVRLKSIGEIIRSAGWRRNKSW